MNLTMPDQPAVPVNRFDAMIRHRMLFTLVIDHIKRKMILAGKDDFLKWDNKDALFESVVIPYLEFVTRPILIPSEAAQHLPHGLHPI